MRNKFVGSWGLSIGTTGVILGALITTSACKFTTDAPDSGSKRAADAAGFNGAPEGGKGGDPTLTPVDPGKAPTPESVAKCRFIDPSKKITEVIPGSPAEVPIPISTFTSDPKLITTSGTNVSFSYEVFQRGDGSEKRLTWVTDAKGWMVVPYKATIKGTDSESCTISAVATAAPEVRTMRGCFAPETLITMADGSRKPIVDIKINDAVRNPLNGTANLVSRVTRGPEVSKGMIEVGFEGGPVVLVTTKHPFITRGGLKQANELSKTDEIIVKGGSFRKVDRLVKHVAKKDQQVVNIAIAGPNFEASSHMLEADGVIAGDLFIQEKLENEKNLKKGLATTK